MAAAVDAALSRFRQLDADCAAARGEFDAWATAQLTAVEDAKKAHVKRVHDANGEGDARARAGPGARSDAAGGGPRAGNRARGHARLRC